MQPAKKVKRIPSSFIDSVVSQIDLVQLVGSSVELKKAGREWVACCPFHDEKTPSFAVVPHKGFFHCQGCGKNGNAVTWLMLNEGLPFVDAVKELARSVSMEVPAEHLEVKPSEDRNAGFKALEASAVAFEQELLKSKRGVTYARSRGMNGDVVRRFRVGFAPEAWGTLRDRRLFSEDVGLEFGMLKRNDAGKVFDAFRDRLMFPIRDTAGRVIAFGGRRLGEKGPKYLNSSESPVFTKGRTLYGLYEALQAKVSETAYVVEGYTDVISLAQHGIEGGLAPLGTAFTEGQAEQAFRHFRRLVCVFDGDKAGRGAAWKAAVRLIPLMRDGREVLFAFMPDGEDPDSMLRKQGRDGFTQVLEAAVPMSTFLLDSLTSRYDVSTREGRGAFLDRVARYLRAMSPCGLRTILIEDTASLVGVTRESFAALVDEEAGLSELTDEVMQANTPVRKALRVLLEQPGLHSQVENLDVYRQIGLDGVDLLVKVVDTLREMRDPDPKALFERFREQEEFKLLVTVSRMPLPCGSDELESFFLEAMDQIMDWARSVEVNRIVEAATQRPLSEIEHYRLKRYLARLESRNAIS